MERIKKLAVHIGLLLSFLLCGASVVLADVGHNDFAQIYYGSDSSMQIVGEELDTARLELVDETLTLDEAAVTAGDNEGSGILFEYDDNGTDTASITLDGTELELEFSRPVENILLSGIAQDAFPSAQVVLKNQSVLVANGEATLETVADSDVVQSLVSGIRLAGDNVEIELLDGSSVSAYANDVDLARSRGIHIDVGADDISAGRGDVVLAGGSGIYTNAAVSVDDDGEAISTGAKLTGGRNDVIHLTLKDESSIISAAQGEIVMGFGAGINGTKESPLSRGVLTVDSGSTIEALAVGPQAAASAFNFYDVEQVEVVLDNGAMLEANALADGESVDDFYPTATGLTIVDADSASVKLAHRSNIMAFGRAEGNASYVDSCAIAIYDVTNNFTLSLDDSSQLQSFQLVTGIDPNPYSVGVDVDNGGSGASVGSANISVANNSSIYSFVASESDTKEASKSWGIHANSLEALHIALDGSSSIAALVNCRGDDVNDAFAYAIHLEAVTSAQISLTDNAYLAAAAWTTGSGTAEAFGVLLEESVAELSLTDGSRIIGFSVGDQGWVDGVCALKNSTLAVSIDATSSIKSQWAAYAKDSTITIDNSGLISGQLQITELTNHASGVLQAKFGSDDNFVYTGELYDYHNGYDYYFLVGDAHLAPTSTIQIDPSDDLGLHTIGDSTSYALLMSNADGGDWDQNNVNLTSTSNSPMLGLDWHEDSDTDHLIVTATFLNPQQAGLSSNATAAFNAAFQDGLFTFDSNPEQWSPNVSGAFVAGMTQTISSSYLNIGNRMGALLGMTSGDGSDGGVVASNGLWFSMRFSDAEQDERDHCSGFDADTTGMSIGFDREFGDSVLGFAYTRGNTEADVDDNSAEFDMTDHLFSLYGSYDGGNWYTEAILSYGVGEVDSMRYIGSDAYAGDYDSSSYNASVSAGLKFKRNGWQVNPLFAVEYSNKDYDSYSETGDGALALQVKSEDYSVFTAGVGAKAQKEFLRDWGTITPELRGMVKYDLDNDRIVSTANFVGGNTSFVAKGVEPSETSWDLGAALIIASIGAENASFRLGYDYSGRQDFAAHSFTGKVSFKF